MDRRSFVVVSLGAAGLTAVPATASAHCHTESSNVGLVVPLTERNDVPNAFENSGELERMFIDIAAGINYVSTCYNSDTGYEYEHTFIAFSTGSVKGERPNGDEIFVDGSHIHENLLGSSNIRNNQLELVMEDEDASMYYIPDGTKAGVAPARDGDADNLADGLAETVGALLESTGSVLPVSTAESIYEEFTGADEDEVDEDDQDTIRFDFGPLGGEQPGAPFVRHFCEFKIATAEWQDVEFQFRSLFANATSGEAELDEQMEFTTNVLQHPDGTATVPVGGPDKLTVDSLDLPCGRNSYRRA